MKTLYQKRYKSGFPHTVNKTLFNTKKPTNKIKLFWLLIIITLITGVVILT